MRVQASRPMSIAAAMPLATAPLQAPPPCALFAALHPLRNTPRLRSATWCARFGTYPFAAFCASSHRVPDTAAFLTAHDSCIGAGYVGGPTMAMIALKWCVPAPSICVRPQLWASAFTAKPRGRRRAAPPARARARLRARDWAGRALRLLRRRAGFPRAAARWSGPAARAAIASGLLPTPEAAAPRNGTDAPPRRASAAPTSRCVRGRQPAACLRRAHRSLGPRGPTFRLRAGCRRGHQPAAY